jgi:REP element-mobilizing transposase RayT
MQQRGPHSRDLRIGRVSMPGHVYLVTTVTVDRAPVFRDLWCARLLIRALRYQASKGHARTLAFVVMPDHLHWLLQLGDRLALSQVVAVAKRWSSEQINRRVSRSGALWQAGFHDHAVRAEEDLRAVARYVIHNPVRAGLVDSVREYPHWDAVWV